MTKKELVNLLEQYSDDTIILVNGHSDGQDFDDCIKVSLITVKEYDKRQWSGKYHNPFNSGNDIYKPEITAISLS